MFKKFFVIVMVLAIALSLCACSAPASDRVSSVVSSVSAAASDLLTAEKTVLVEEEEYVITKITASTNDSEGTYDSYDYLVVAKNDVNAVMFEVSAKEYVMWEKGDVISGYLTKQSNQTKARFNMADDIQFWVVWYGEIN